jgi:hypothetical protein
MEYGGVVQSGIDVVFGSGERNFDAPNVSMRDEEACGTAVLDGIAVLVVLIGVVGAMPVDASTSFIKLGQLSRNVDISGRDSDKARAVLGLVEAMEVSELDARLEHIGAFVRGEFLVGDIEKSGLALVEMWSEMVGVHVSGPTFVCIMASVSPNKLEKS